MSRLVWEVVDDYLAGVDHGVLYIESQGISWNGLVSVKESSSGEGIQSYYFDGIKTLDTVGSEDFVLAVEAFVYPDEFEDLVLPFGFSYRSGQKIHLVYNARADSTDKGWSTLSDTVEPSNFGWDISTVPTIVPGAKPTAHLVINLAEAHPDAIQQVEDLLYGTDITDPTLPSAEDIVAIFSEFATLVVVDHGDGTWTATGPDEAIQMLDLTTFEISWPSAVYIDSESYTISSM
jgi:hypothetical protein